MDGAMDWANTGVTWNSVSGIPTIFYNSISSYALAQAVTTIHPVVYINQQIPGIPAFIIVEMMINGPIGDRTSWDNIVDNIGGNTNLQSIALTILWDLFWSGATSGSYNIVNRWGGLIAQVMVALERQVGIGM